MHPCRTISFLIGFLPALLACSMAYAQWTAPADTFFVSPDNEEVNLEAAQCDADGFLHALWTQYRFEPYGYRLLYSTTRPDGVWQPPDTVNSSDEVIEIARNATMIFSGQPYVAYQVDSTLILATRQGGVWNREVLSVNGGSIFHPAMTLDSVGRAHLTYIEALDSAHYILAYRALVGGAVTQLIPNSDLGYFGLGANPQIACTPNGTVDIAFMRIGLYGELWHVWNHGFQDTVWEVEPIQTLNGFHSDVSASTLLSPDGVLYVAVSSDSITSITHADRKILFLQKENGIWQPPREFPWRPYNLDAPKIRMDADGRMHLVMGIFTGSGTEIHYFMGWLVHSVWMGNDSWSTEVLPGNCWMLPQFFVNRNSMGQIIANTPGQWVGETYNLIQTQSIAPLTEDPVLAIDPAYMDFGAVQFNTDVVRTLVIRNDGSDTITIADIQSGDGYTTSFAGPIQIAPDDESQVDVHFTPTGFQSYDSELHVISEAPHRVAVALTTGIGYPDLPASDRPGVPRTFDVAACPNPFNPSTEISFTLPNAAMVDVRVYNLLGREVNHLIEQNFSAGAHRVMFDGAELKTGVYFARISAAHETRILKLLLLK